MGRFLVKSLMGHRAHVLTLVTVKEIARRYFGSNKRNRKILGLVALANLTALTQPEPSLVTFVQFSELDLLLARHSDPRVKLNFKGFTAPGIL